MSDHKDSAVADCGCGDPPAVDARRRAIASAGAAGAGILMSVASRSALGAGFGQCGSESVSAAMSRHGEVAYCGCSPGFWWRSPHGPKLWADTSVIPSAYGPTKTFNAVFGVQFFKWNYDKTLGSLGPGQGNLDTSQVNDRIKNCSGLHSTVFHAIAALLNAEYYGNRYPAPYKTPAAVIAAFQAAFNHNNPCGQLNSFKGAVDVYEKAEGLWCFNGKSTNDVWSERSPY